MENGLYLIIRLRGTADLHPDVRHTLNLLRLRKRYSASLYHSSLPGIRDMLRKAEYWITYGEIDKDVLAKLLEVRGRLEGDKPITDEWVVETLGLKGGIQELAEKLVKGEIHYHKLAEKGVKPFFRLHPPKKGFKKSIKRHYKDSGELGYRGKDINNLVLRMI